MENLEQNEMAEVNPSLHTVTPLSKYLAMILFVTLPFIGGWIGYTYAPEKVVEVEKIVTNEVPTSSNNWALPTKTPSDEIAISHNKVFNGPLYTFSNSSIPNWYLYQSHRFDFELLVPSNFSVTENDLNSSETMAVPITVLKM